MSGYRHTPEMGEISGFGGGYEQCCQDMLEAGVVWLNQHPEREELRFKGYEGVFGWMKPVSDSAKQLEQAVLVASRREATGAQFHAVIERLLYISQNGWQSYCDALVQRQREKKQQVPEPPAC